ncbi:MAG: hypothetical protein QXV37_02440, partial [Candidatus Jordarchaeaceae archaeon]
IDLGQWVRMYPGFGVIMTSKPNKAQSCLEIFRNVGVSAEIIGEVDNSKRLLITNGKEVCEVFNFNYDKISGKIW